MKVERLNSFVWLRVLYRSALNAVFYLTSLILFQDIHLFSIKHCAKEQNTVNWQTRLTKWQDGTDKCLGTQASLSGLKATLAAWNYEGGFLYRIDTCLSLFIPVYPDKSGTSRENLKLQRLSHHVVGLAVAEDEDLPVADDFARGLAILLCGWESRFHFNLIIIREIAPTRS